LENRSFISFKIENSLLVRRKIDTLKNKEPDELHLRHNEGIQKMNKRKKQQYLEKLPKFYNSMDALMK